MAKGRSAATAHRRPIERRGTRQALDAPAILRGRPASVLAEGLLQPLYDTIGNPGGWRGFLEALSDAYGGGMSCIVAHDYATQTGFAEMSAGCDAAFVNSYANYYARLNPWFGAAEQRPVGVSVLSDEMMRYPELLRTEFYNDWCRPQTLGGGVGATIERNGRRTTAISVLLPRPTIDQDAAVLTRLQFLTPHILRVSQLHRQFAALQARAAAAEGALDRLATAMLLLDAAERIVYLNTQAERIAAMADGLRLRQNRLVLAKTDEQDRLQRFIASVLRGDGHGPPLGGVMQVSRPSARPAFEVLVAPISDTVTQLGLPGRLVAVFIRDPELACVTPVASLRQAFGLTAAEGRLMQLLLGGEDLRAASDHLGVTYETARSQIKAIFQKTGAKTQSDLIRMGLRSLTAVFQQG